MSHKAGQKNLIEKSAIKGPIDVVPLLPGDSTSTEIEMTTSKMQASSCTVGKIMPEIDIQDNLFRVTNLTSDNSDPEQATKEIFRKLKGTFLKL